MERILEPELMLDEEQARAYSEADFSSPHQMFVELFQKHFGSKLTGHVLDLGCGPADVTVRFAKAYPEVNIIGIDGSPAMLKYAQKRIIQEGLSSRIKLVLGKIPEIKIPIQTYTAIISNSLLHHLPNPLVLWNTIKEISSSGSKIFIMDLLRPDSPQKAREIVEKYAAHEAEVLKKDFYCSLLAGFCPQEIKQQLKKSKLSFLKCKIVSNRHYIIYGIFP